MGTSSRGGRGRATAAIVSLILVAGCGSGRVHSVVGASGDSPAVTGGSAATTAAPPALATTPASAVPTTGPSSDRALTPTTAAPTTVRSPVSSVPFVGIECTSLTGPPYVFEGCTGDTGGQSLPFGPTGNGPWTITWSSHRTTVVTADPTPATPPTPGAVPCAGQVDVQYKVISGYVDGGPLPGVLHASFCLGPLSLQPGTLLTIS